MNIEDTMEDEDRLAQENVAVINFMRDDIAYEEITELKTHWKAKNVVRRNSSFPDLFEGDLGKNLLNKRKTKPSYSDTHVGGVNDIVRDGP